MPHKCVKCDEVYDDDASEVMDGCMCGSKVFMYARKEQVSAVRSIKSTEDGKFELDIRWLFDKNDNAKYAHAEDGKYDIDIEAAFQKK